MAETRDTPFKLENVFHVMNQGWFCEAEDGKVWGPFATRLEARAHVGKPKHPKRIEGERIFYVNERDWLEYGGVGWHVRTRGGVRGPFESRDDALRYVELDCRRSGEKRQDLW